MASTQQAYDDQSPYLVVPNLQVNDPSVREIDLGHEGHSWMVATVIEDDDLMFGGKPLSAWYEEERRRQSMASYSGSECDEEERRGRQRERPVAQEPHHPTKRRGHKGAKQ